MGETSPVAEAGPSPHVLWDAAYDMGGTEVRFGLANPTQPPKRIMMVVILVIKTYQHFDKGPAIFLEIGFLYLCDYIVISNFFPFKDGNFGL